MVNKQGWSLKKPLEARMTKSVVSNLPHPVVIIHQLYGKDGNPDTEKKILILSQKERKKYGNLIEGYSIKSKM